ncbi:hypothetical protein BDW74DRAFT_157068 [Aspergillus multicolor]|uniref:uncharacterized protein n=1 Tax=Aspergillus multicolor TaxID=41759 RepID=UPI003CCD6508
MSFQSIAPLGQPPPSPRPLPPSRNNVRMACNPCRSSRTKCDGLRPNCSTCIAHNRTCEYRTVDRRTRSDLTAHIHVLEDEILQLKNTIQRLQAHGTPEASHQGQHVRERAEQASADPKGKQPLTAISPAPHSDTKHTKSGPLAEENTEQYNTGFGCIPVEHVTHHTISAFFSCIGILVYVQGQDYVERLMLDVYHDEATNKESLCELCSFAAVGCQYNSIHTFTSREEYFRPAILHLCDTLEADTEQAIRAIICLATYLILTNTKSSRALIDCGITLSRQLLPMQGQFLASNQPQNLQLLRLFQSLTTLESWLSVNINYCPSITVDDIQFLENLKTQEAQDDSDVHSVLTSQIQFYFNKVAVLSSQIHASLRKMEHVAWHDIQRGSDNLDAWRRDLPAVLQLRALLTEDINVKAPFRQAVLMLHMIYLESQVLLYESYIQQQGQHNILHSSLDNHMTYCGFAQQLSHIISVIYHDQCGFTHSWIIIHASFHACIVLILDFCQRLLHFESTTTLVTNEKGIKACLLVLQNTACRCPAAEKFIDMLGPPFEHLQAISQRLISSSISQRPQQMKLAWILNYRNPSQAELYEILGQVIDSMELPGTRL